MTWGGLVREREEMRRAAEERAWQEEAALQAKDRQVEHLLQFAVRRLQQKWLVAGLRAWADAHQHRKRQERMMRAAAGRLLRQPKMPKRQPQMNA